MTRARDNADLGDSYGVLAAGVTGGSGLTALGTVTAGNLSNTAIVYPAGHIINSWGDQETHSSNITVTNTGGQASNPDSITDVNTGNRVYGECFSVAVNVSSTTSDLLIMGTNGLTYQTNSATGAFGFVFNVPSPSANRAYDSSNYPYYQASGSWGGNRYPSDDSKTLYIKGSDSLVKSGAYNIKIYGFAYSEGAGATQTYVCRHSSLAIFEIKR